MNKEVWLVFRNGQHIFERFFKDGFGHVSLLFRGVTHWVLVSPNERSMDVIELPYKIEDNAPQWLANDKEMFFVVKVIYEQVVVRTKIPRFFIGFTCVSFAKYYLGYKDLSVTPYGLYKNLKKQKKNIIKVEDL